MKLLKSYVFAFKILGIESASVTVSWSGDTRRTQDLRSTAWASSCSIARDRRLRCLENRERPGDSSRGYVGESSPSSLRTSLALSIPSVNPLLGGRHLGMPPERQCQVRHDLELVSFTANPHLLGYPSLSRLVGGHLGRLREVTWCP